MNISELLKRLEERTQAVGRTQRDATLDKSEKVKSEKSRVPIFKSISDALKRGHYGLMFTTKRAKRLYVVSKGKWGKKSGRGKIAKGFSYSPPFSKVKGFSNRTKKRFGGSSKGK